MKPNEASVAVAADDEHGATVRTAEKSPTSGEPGSGPEVGRIFDVALFGHAKDNRPTSQPWDFPTLAAVFQRRSASGLVDVTVNGDDDHDNELKRNGLAFSLCRYRLGTTRAKKNVEVVSGFVMDLDGVDEADVADVKRRLGDLGACAVGWTTWSNGWRTTPQAWRIVVPFAADVDADDWPDVWPVLTDVLSGGRNDEQTKDASRMHFFPRAPRNVPDGDGGTRPNDPIRFFELPGSLLDPAPFIAAAHRKRTADSARKSETDLGFDVGDVDLGDGPRSRPDRVERARLWLARADAAVSGSGGHATAMRVVGGAVRGFDLNDGDAVAALQEWNARCAPPWSDSELRHKVSQAQSTPDPKGRGRGWLLNAADAADVDAVDWQAVIREARRSHSAGPADGHAGADKNDRTDGAGPAPPVSSVLSAWAPPMPIRAEPLRPFPVAQLPAPLADYVGAVAAALQVPPDLPALGVLAACSAAVQRRIEVAPTSDWRETLSLYALGVAESADRKSAVMTEVQRPLRTIEGRLATEARPAVTKRAADRRVLEKRLKKAETFAAEESDPAKREKFEAEVEALAHTLAGLPALHLPRLLADDVTPEVVAVILAEQSERLAIFSAEGGVFGTMAGRYSKNGDANVDVFLKGHCGDGLRVDRKTKDPQTGERACVALDRPALTMALFVQPDVLDEVIKNKAFSGRGLVARFLYAYPQSLVGTRAVDAPPVPSATRHAYAATIERLFARATAEKPAPVVRSDTDLGFDVGSVGERQRTDAATLVLDDDAAGLLRAFRHRIEPRLAPETGDLACLGSWGGKLVGAIVRVAALFHLVMDDTNNDAVCGDAMARAIALADYFVDHAKGAMRLMGIDPTSRKALLILRAAKTHGWQTVSRRDVHRALESTFSKAAYLEAPLALLEERGWIRWLPQPDGKSGRPSQCLVFHPSTHDGT